MKKIVVLTAVSAALFFSPAAFAAGSGQPPCGMSSKPGQPQSQPCQKVPQNNKNGVPQNAKRPPAPDERQPGHKAPVSNGPVHNGPPRQGQMLPPAHRGQPVPPSAYNRHHLPPPPRGQQWVQVDGTYALINIASGLVMSVMTGR